MEVTSKVRCESYDIRDRREFQAGESQESRTRDKETTARGAGHAYGWMGLAETPIKGRAMGASVGFQPVWALDGNIGQRCLRLTSIRPPVVLGEGGCQNSSLCLSPSCPQNILRDLAKHRVENQTQHVPWLSRLITLLKRKCGWPSSGLTWSL